MSSARRRRIMLDLDDDNDEVRDLKVDPNLPLVVAT